MDTLISEKHVVSIFSCEYGRQHVSPKRRHLLTSVHGAVAQNNNIVRGFILCIAEIILGPYRRLGRNEKYVQILLRKSEEKGLFEYVGLDGSTASVRP